MFIAFSSSTAEDFIKECNISKKFDHPNVLSLIGVCIIPKESVPLMVMPFMHHGDVKSFLKSKRGNDIKVENFPPVTLATYIVALCCFTIHCMNNYIYTVLVNRLKFFHNKHMYDSLTSKGILIKAHISMAAKKSQQMKHKTCVSFIQIIV